MQNRKLDEINRELRASRRFEIAVSVFGYAFWLAIAAALIAWIGGVLK